MKKLIFTLVGVILTLSGFSNLAYADANNFRILDFSADYYLSKDAENRSVLRVQETIVAEFPDFNQNHGIERAIPLKYQGYVSYQKDLRAELDGAPVGISSETDEGNVVYRIGDANSYVHGVKTYTLEYSFRDVMRSDLSPMQMLIWNTNGTQWKQRFGSVEARLHIPKDLVASFQDGACYYGRYGSDKSCGQKPKPEIYDNGDMVITYGQKNLFAGENVTFWAGFKSGTFAEYQEPAFYGVIRAVMMFALILPVGLLVWLIYVWVKFYRSAKSNRSVAAQYIPPKEATLFESAILLGRDSKFITAAILKMAVSGNLQIKEVEKQGVFGKNKEYYLKKLSAEGLSKEEEKTFNLIFRASDEVKTSKLGERLISYGERALEWRKSFYETDFFKEKKFKVGIIVALTISAAGFFGILFLLSLLDDAGVSIPALTIVGWFGLIIANFVVSTILTSSHPKSEKGAAMVNYLEGLKLYIKLAEADRLKFLQSAEGAERVMDGENAKVKLYERLLPYAVLFGLEKSWAQVIAAEYQDGTSPDWYAGSGAFNAALFASTITSVSSSVNSYTSSASSSAGGGGGFSGGGGGGGGGGGW